MCVPFLGTIEATMASPLPYSSVNFYSILFICKLYNLISYCNTGTGLGGWWRWLFAILLSNTKTTKSSAVVVFGFDKRRRPIPINTFDINVSLLLCNATIIITGDDDVCRCERRLIRSSVKFPYNKCKGNAKLRINCKDMVKRKKRIKKVCPFTTSALQLVLCCLCLTIKLLKPD